MFQSVCKYYCINTNHQQENTIILAGTGRSGTTWVSNIINYANEYRDIFEPFDPRHTKLWKDSHYKQYLRASDHSQKHLEAAQKILTGRINNRWINQHNRRFLCDKRLVKDIRANLMLKWLKVHFPRIPLIFIMRHPCAVALSRVKLGWDTWLDEILKQQDLVDDFLSTFIDDIYKEKGEFERQIYLWCIENYIPLNTLEKDDFFMLFYEELCVYPERETKKLFNWLGKEYNDSVRSAFRIPSVVAERHSAIHTGNNLITQWKQTVTQKQLVRSFDIIKKFGLDKYYSDSTLPVFGKEQ